MKKKILSLKKLYGLQEELKEIMGLKLNILTRYKLSELKKSVDESLVGSNETKDALIKEFGEVGPENISIKVYIDEGEKEVNPKFLEFLKEWDLVLATEKEISYSPVSLNSIAELVTEKPVEVLFELIEENA